MKKALSALMLGALVTSCNIDGKSGSKKNKKSDIERFQAATDSNPCASQMGECAVIKNLSLEEFVEILNSSSHDDPVAGDQIVVQSYEDDNAFTYNENTNDYDEEKCMVLKNTEKTVYAVNADHMLVLEKEEILDVKPATKACNTLKDNAGEYTVSKESLPSQAERASMEKVEEMNLDVNSLFLGRLKGEEVLVMNIDFEGESEGESGSCTTANGVEDCETETVMYRYKSKGSSIYSLDKNGFNNGLYSFSKGESTNLKTNKTYKYFDKERIIKSGTDHSLLEMDISDLSVTDNTK